MIFYAKIISIDKNSSLEDAWNTLRHHKINLLPVLNADQDLCGVISLVDYLKRLQTGQPAKLHQRLRNLLYKKQHLGPELSQPVASIMVKNLVTIGEEEPVTKAVLLLSEAGFHHIPVVTKNHKLVGMISQSDIIAALYASATRADEYQTAR